MAIEHILFDEITYDDMPDIAVINTILQQIETKINETIDQINDALIFVSQTDEYVEVTHTRKIHAGGGTKYRNIIRKEDAIERG